MMKKLIVFSILSLLLSSCACVIGQVPPLTLHVDATCGAAIPDYRPMLHWTDNCGIDTVEQTPTPGSWLIEKFNTVHFRAIDNFGNYTDVLGSLELIDTIPPSLVDVDSTLAISEYDKANNLYDQAERIIANMDWWQTWPDSIPITEDYANYYLVCYSSPLHALRDRLPVENSHRVWTFAKAGTVIKFGEEAGMVIVPIE